MRRMVGHVTDQEIWKGTGNKRGEVESILCNMGQLGTTVQVALEPKE